VLARREVECIVIAGYAVGRDRRRDPRHRNHPPLLSEVGYIAPRWQATERDALGIVTKRKRWWLVPALAGLGLALLMAAWVATTRPFDAPDENAHYLRALSITNGKLLGPRAPYSNPKATSTERAWQSQDARGVLVPARMAPPSFGYAAPELCVDGKPDVGRRACVEASYTGDYLPLPYLLPALALKSADGWREGLLLSRALSAFVCLAFILLAIAVLWSGREWSVLGPLAAVTPMVLFISSMVNPSGMEISAGIAFASAGLRIVRDRGSTPAWIWIVLVCSGAATILAWQLGPVFVGVNIAVLAALLESGGAREFFARSGRWISILAIVLIAAFGLYLTWMGISGMSHSKFEVAPLIWTLRIGFEQLHPMANEWVGVFGWRSVWMPNVLYLIWGLLVVCIVSAAVLLGTPRQRMVVVGVTILGLVFPVLFYIWVYRFSGFAPQGRYTLPLLVLMPLVGGEVMQRASNRIPAPVSRSLFAIGVALVAVVQLAAWWTNARAAAGHSSDTLFMTHSAWLPPLGWWPWLALAIAGSAAIVASGVVALRREYDRELALTVLPQT
jgi:Predicted membrane protein (DUF2142)